MGKKAGKKRRNELKLDSQGFRGLCLFLANRINKGLDPFRIPYHFSLVRPLQPSSPSRAQVVFFFILPLSVYPLRQSFPPLSLF